MDQKTEQQTKCTRAYRHTPVHVMVKPAGATCNMDCTYCYYLSKQRLYPQSSARMSEGLLEDYTRQFIGSQTIAEVTLSWQEGAPTLIGFSFFQSAVELQKKFRKPGMRVQNSIQTNGTLLDDKWEQFSQENHFLVGISLNGPRQYHDVYHKDKRGRSSFDKVMRGVSVLKRNNVEFNILTCFHAANMNHPLAVYRFFQDEVGAEFIQYIPIVECDNDTRYQEGNRFTSRSVIGKKDGEYLIDIFDEWVRRDVGQVFIQIFDVALARWYGQRPGLCVFDETCGLALVTEDNGDLYACDHYVEPSYFLGNIQETALHYEGHKAFFQHIDRPMDIMAYFLRNHRPPAEIMRIIAQE